MSSFASLLLKKPLLLTSAAAVGTATTVWSYASPSFPSMVAAEGEGRKREGGTVTGLRRQDTARGTYVLTSPRGLVQVSSPSQENGYSISSSSLSRMERKEEGGAGLRRQETKRSYVLTSPRGLVCVSSPVGVTQGRNSSGGLRFLSQHRHHQHDNGTAATTLPLVSSSSAGPPTRKLSKQRSYVLTSPRGIDRKSVV